MSQTIIRSYLKAIKEQFLRIISIVNILIKQKGLDIL